AAGAAIALNRHVTIAEDLVGTELIHAERVILGSNQELDGSVIPGIGFIRKSLNSSGVSSGVKVKFGGNFLLTANLLARVNHGGLRAAVAPLVGLSYVFNAPAAASESPRPARVPVSARPGAPLRDLSPDAVRNLHRSYQPDLDRMVQELN